MRCEGCGTTRDDRHTWECPVDRAQKAGVEVPPMGPGTEVHDRLRVVSFTGYLFGLLEKELPWMKIVHSTNTMIETNDFLITVQIRKPISEGLRDANT
jgi:hypothetical protein